MELIDLLLMAEQPSIQNLDYLRQLIQDVRGQQPGGDMQRLRMLQGYGVGTDAMTQQTEDRR
jgi:hypothetical protein